MWVAFEQEQRIVLFVLREGVSSQAGEVESAGAPAGVAVGLAGSEAPAGAPVWAGALLPGEGWRLVIDRTTRRVVEEERAAPAVPVEVPRSAA
ncbi:MAG: hypothetical protein IMX02_12815 [Limnochordaceae bacterium]|nr:hypothetical protein [Limnochordaceae bacterium]